VDNRTAKAGQRLDRKCIDIDRFVFLVWDSLVQNQVALYFGRDFTNVFDPGASLVWLCDGEGCAFMLAWQLTDQHAILGLAPSAMHRQKVAAGSEVGSQAQDKAIQFSFLQVVDF
jgi:hypothetical protein